MIAFFIRIIRNMIKVQSLESLKSIKEKLKKELNPKVITNPEKLYIAIETNPVNITLDFKDALLFSELINLLQELDLIERDMKSSSESSSC